MLPFYKRNEELMELYIDIMEGMDDSKKEAIQPDYIFLKEIKDNRDSCKDINSKFHCLGEPFDANYYKEDDYTVRLYYSIKDKLPIAIEVNPSHTFGRRAVFLLCFQI